VVHPFAASAPSRQQTLDIFEGQWITAFPEDWNVTAGWVDHFDPQIDARVPWAESQIPGGLAGKTVLELGPFEGYHTVAFEQRGAAHVTSVEASRTAYLKCLVVKDLFDLQASLLYGDVPSFLAQTNEEFDVVWASGILYHQADPVSFLELAADRGDHLFLHTHFFDQAAAAESSMAPRFRTELDTEVIWRGRSMRLHRYEYETDTVQGTFAGGPQRYANWMEKADIEFMLAELGFATVVHGVVDFDNPSGPGMYLLASRG